MPDVSKVKPLARHKHSVKMRGKAERNAIQREADLSFIADHLVRGLTHSKIAELLSAERKYKISRPTVTKDIAVIQDRWRLLCHDDIQRHKSEQLARLDRMEAHAWAAIEDAKDGVEKKTGRTSKYSAKLKKSDSATRTTETRDHTPSWLRTIQFCIEQRSKILGLYAPLKIDAGKGGLHLGDVVNNNFMPTVEVNITTSKPVEELSSFTFLDAESIPLPTDETDAED